MRWAQKMLGLSLGLSLAVMPGTASADVTQQNVDTLTRVYSTLVHDHYTHPDQDQLLKAAIEGMLKALNDPFTSYMTPEEYKGFIGAINQEYAGIGMSHEPTEDGWVRVTRVFKGTPAEQAGLKVDDVVLKVDGREIKGLAPEEVGMKIRGKEGTKVELTVQRGEEVLTLSITRAAIELPLVMSEDLGNGIGYVQVFSFGERTAREFKEAVADLEAKGAKGLILDLRGNGGGLVQGAIEIADYLLGYGTIFALHEGGKKIEITSDPDSDPIPLVVLIDGQSASASELLAGALQKNGRTKLVGLRSYGKGTIQSPKELPNGGYLKVSIDRWELPDGTSPDKVGLTPDLQLTHPAAMLNGAMQLLLPDRKQRLVYALKSEATLNDKVLKGAPLPVQAEGRTYLPLRFTMEALGVPVQWVAAEGAVTFAWKGRQVKIDAEKTLWIDGKRSTAAKAVRVIDGSTYFSVEACTEILGVPVVESENRVDIQV
jgi:carboxyl-terminal processing protease